MDKNLSNTLTKNTVLNTKCNAIVPLFIPVLQKAETVLAMRYSYYVPSWESETF